MQIRQVLDPQGLADFQRVNAAAYEHDYRLLPAETLDQLLALLDGDDEEAERPLLFLGTREGVAVGTLMLRLPMLDNLGTANSELNVHPRHRRQGAGRALLEHAVAVLRAEGRGRLFVEVPSREDGSPGPGVGLVEHCGAKPVLEEVRRLLDLREHPPELPVGVPDGYRVVQWVDRTPDPLAEGVAYLLGRMTLDAPLGDMDYEPESWDVARLRASEARSMARGRLRISTAVVHCSGAVAGHTDVAVNRQDPRVASQWDTIVDPAHRGHGLGVVLKSWNHRQLVDLVPEVACVNTWNAVANRHMVAVNEALGFEPVETWTEYQLDL